MKKHIYPIMFVLLLAQALGVFYPANQSWINDTTPTFQWEYAGEDATINYTLTIDDTADFGSPILTQTDITGLTYTLTGGQALADDYYYWYVEVYNASMNLTNVSNSSFGSDATNPVSGTASINNAATYTNITTVTLSWVGFSDATAGILYYYYNDSDLSAGTGGTIVSNTTSAVNVSGLSEGVNTLYVWAEDAAQNKGTAASDTVIVDLTNPLLSSWTKSPTTIRYDTTSAFNISTQVIDTNFLASNPPQCRYNVTNGTSIITSQAAWQNMTIYSGTTYWYAINLNWNTYQGLNLTYECRVFDAVNRSYYVTRPTEYIRTNAEPPSFVNLQTSLNSITWTEDANSSFIIEGYDDDLDTLSFSSNASFTFVQLTSTTSRGYLIPTNSQVGSTSVLFTVSDGIYSITQAATLTVQGVNDAPILNPIGNLEGYLHEPFVYSVICTDPENENYYALDDDFHTFSTFGNISWFRILSVYNSSTGYYHGLINFTPLLSHKGKHNITISVTDGTETDSEEIIFTVGYCGDLDSSDEPKCDSDYESCSSCPSDCGVCSNNNDKDLTIIVSQRNCIEQNFTLETFELVQRGTCEKEGTVVNDREVCENLSSVTVTIYRLEDKKWEEYDEYTTDEDGKAVFVPTAAGSYKLIASKRRYNDAIKYLDFNECEKSPSSQETTVTTSDNINTETKNKGTESAKQSSVEEPSDITDLGDFANASTAVVIIWYVVIPTILVILVLLSYYYYQKEKNNKAWILKARICVYQKEQEIKPMLLKYWYRIRNFLGFG